MRRDGIVLHSDDHVACKIEFKIKIYRPPQYREIGMHFKTGKI